MPVPGTASRRFGEPVPGLVILFSVALAVRAPATWAGVRVGVALRIRAAAPATCGAAIEVPLIVLVAVSPVLQAEVMFWPGAKMSVQVPQLENEARASVFVEALTVIASGVRAGEALQALAFVVAGGDRVGDTAGDRALHRRRRARRWRRRRGSCSPRTASRGWR